MSVRLKLSFLFCILLASQIVLAEEAFWRPTVIKFNPDRTSEGFCLETSQCLINSNFNPKFDNNTLAFFTGSFDTELPKCLSSGQFVIDNFCNNGVWTSRTTLVALELLDIATKSGSLSYTLFCDAPEEVLNNIDYQNRFGFVRDFFSENCDIEGRKVPCVNNVCVLTYNKGVALGVSLNHPIDGINSFLKSLSLSSDRCDNALGSIAFTKCFVQTGAEIFYNDAIQSMLVLPFDTPLFDNLLQLFVEFVRTPFDAFMKFVRGREELTVPGFDILAQRTRLFNNLYINHNNGKEIFAFVEKGQTKERVDYLGLKYTGYALPEDFCDRLKLFEHKSLQQNIACESKTNNLNLDYFVTARGYQGQSSVVVKAWKDMTAKLRPK